MTHSLFLGITFSPNLNVILKTYNVIMGGSLMMVHFWNSVKNMACLSISLVLILLAHASLPPSFWHNSLQMETYLLNILQSKLLENKSPLEILYESEPSYSHLRVFGCLCYTLFPSPTINKLQSDLLRVYFWDFPRIIVATNSMIHPLIKLSFVDMLFFMRIPSPSQSYILLLLHKVIF